MAEGKKSFLIYSDTINNIEHLTNEEKGILFQHLLEYVNDLNPVLTDRLLLTAWKPIETHLKRDLKKWTDKAPERTEKARNAGIASGKARELKRTKTNSVVQNELKATKRTVIDSVSVSVNGSVSDNVIVKDINKRKAEFKNSLNQFVDNNLDEAIKFLDYWTEHGDKDRKMRFEKEKSFSLKSRWARWLKNSEQWKKEKSFEKKEKLTAAQALRKKYGISDIQESSAN